MDAERAVLAACLHAPAAIDTADRLLQVENFATPAHRLVWAAMLALHQEDGLVDPVTVTHRLRRQGVLHQAGGPGYVSGLASAVHSVSAVDHYAVIVADQAWSARLHQLGKWLVQATTGGREPAEVHAQALDRLAATGGGPPRGMTRTPEAVVRPLQQRTVS